MKHYNEKSKIYLILNTTFQKWNVELFIENGCKFLSFFFFYGFDIITRNKWLNINLWFDTRSTNISIYEVKILVFRRYIKKFMFE